MNKTNFDLLIFANIIAELGQLAIKYRNSEVLAQRDLGRYLQAVYEILGLMLKEIAREGK